MVGNLNILDSVGTSNIDLKNIVVLGDIVISASQISSVQLTDVKAKNIIVEDKDNPLEIICNDNVSISNANLPSAVKIQKVGTNVTI